MAEVAERLGFVNKRSYLLTVLVTVEKGKDVDEDEVLDRIMQECDYSVDYEDSECKIVKTQLLDGEKNA